MNYWTLGRELDQKMFEFRHKGMNGTPEEREQLLKEVFHGARSNGRFVLWAAPVLGKTREDVLGLLMTKVLENVAAQGRRPSGNRRWSEPASTWRISGSAWPPAK